MPDPKLSTAMFKDIASQRLTALFLVGWLLLNFPLLGLWDIAATCWGIPVFPLALFALWGGLITAVAWLVDRPEAVQEDTSA